MGTIRQYLKQKVARSFGGKRVDLDIVKKELKDEITHILYDQTRRTPIVIPVINEIGGGGNGGGQGQGQNQNQNRQRNAPHERPERQDQPAVELPLAAPIAYPAPQVPDTEAVDPRVRPDTRAY
jgi:ribonuclease J